VWAPQHTYIEGHCLCTRWSTSSTFQKDTELIMVKKTK